MTLSHETSRLAFVMHHHDEAYEHGWVDHAIECAAATCNGATGQLESRGGGRAGSDHSTRASGDLRQQYLAHS